MSVETESEVVTAAAVILPRGKHGRGGMGGSFGLFSVVFITIWFHLGMVWYDSERGGFIVVDDDDGFVISAYTH